MSKPPLNLTSLPAIALDRIISHSLTFGTSPIVLLSQLGSTISEATKRVLATTLTLPDDDSILLVIEREVEKDEERRGSSLVTAVSTSHSHLVKHLEVVRPAPRSISSAEKGNEQLEDEEEEEVLEISPLDEHGFLTLLERFPNLSSFTWRSYRLPAEDLCIDLANSAKNLRSFTFDLVPSPFRDHYSGLSTLEASPLFGTSPCSPSSLHSLLPLSSTPSLRWDCPSLSSLPGSLTSLSLSSLSHAGVQEFASSLPSFFALEHLELSKTVFIDDHLLQEVSQGLSKSLKSFTIREMGGTKLSDQGMNSLFEGCSELERFEMDCVEGRLSKSCWSKIVTFPPRLRSIKISYSESPPHKSWILDHLQSLPDLLSVPSLTSFTLSRKLHRESLVPGSHHLARHPMDTLLTPRKLTRQELEAIIGSGGGGSAEAKRWIDLDLDLVLIDGDSLKKLLENCTELRWMKVCFDSQFKNLLSLSSAFSACLHLQRFSVSIPLEHTPELQTLTPATYNPSSLPSPSISLAGSPSSKASNLPPTSPSTSPTKPLADLPNLEQCLPDSIQALLPPTRDWRRFLKKSHSLSSISWTGRGGIGKFSFGKIEGKGLIKITFEPTPPLSSSSGSEESFDEIGGRRREREDSWTSSFSFSSSSTSSISTFSSPTAGGGLPFMRRRASSSSATTSCSPTTPTKSLASSSRKFGSIDAAFSPSSKSSSSHRRASTTPSLSSGFGVIGSSNGGGGAGTRRKPSFDHGSIGTGWSGFHSPTPTTSIPENDISPTSTFDPFHVPAEKEQAGEGGGGLQMNLGATSSLLETHGTDDKSRVSSDRRGSILSTTTTTAKNPWSSVPSSVTSPTPAVGWASSTPSPPRASATPSGEKTNGAHKSSVPVSPSKEPTSSKMSRSSRSSSSQGGGSGSPSSSRSSRVGGGGSSTGGGGANRNGYGREQGSGESNKKKDGTGSGDSGRRRRDRGTRSGRGGGARKEGGVNA
ncbi:hypothetical protein JCM3765_005211 [Sporobolomyces pararoseus]